MSVEHIEILVEEPSMEALLRELLPLILGPITFEIHPFSGKSDLLRKLPNRLKGYVHWSLISTRILIILDRDNDDCVELKNRLDQMVEDAGLVGKSRAAGQPYVVVTRLAIEELEAWYFGDWLAVQAAYPRVSPDVPSKAKYRNPDAIAGGTWESFERELQRAGYFTAGLGKIEAARQIGPKLDPSRNRSPSFCALRDVLVELSAVASGTNVS